MTTRQWAIIAALFVAVLIVFCVMGVYVFASLSPSRTEVVRVIVTATPSTPTDIPTPRPTPTPQPTPTLAVLKMTIDEIEKCCKDMTTIQEKQYLSSLVGSRVNWQGTLDDAKPDGTLWVKVSSTRIEMNGAPANVAAKLAKGQFIDFYAIITKAENSWLMPGVQLRFESLNTNAVTPTPILIPTSTVAPLKTLTSTPASSLSGAEQQYMDSALEIMEPYFDGADEVGGLLKKAGNNILLVGDESWRSNMVVNMAILKLQGENFRKLVPPSRFAPFHSDVVGATRHMDKAVDLIAAGIDGKNASNLNQAAQEVVQANALIESATKKGYALLTPVPATNVAKPTMTRTPTRTR